MKNKTLLQIIEQLKDSSHPPIVLLDGAWGIGKTYLVETELRSFVEAEEEVFGTYHYISVFGISSITEFLDQVISLYISNEKESASRLNTLTQLSSKIAKCFGADDSQAGVIQGTISGLAGVVRQQLIQKMTGFTLVIDDLERLTDDKLIADIMGTCLRFAEHNKIKVIVVANASAFTDKTKVEKSFSDVIKLTRSKGNLLEIIFDIYAEQLPTEIKEQLPQIFDRLQSYKLDINNLRVLQRALNRMIKLVDKVKEINGVDQKRTIEMLTESIAIVTLYSYNHRLDIDGFLSINEKVGNWTMQLPNSTELNSSDEGKDLTKEEQLQKDLYEQLNSLLNRQSCNSALAEYCFTNVLPDIDDSTFTEQFGLLRENNLIDLFKRGSFYLCDSEEEFQQGLNDLIKLLFVENNVPWSDWIGCCDTYIYLIEQGYLEDTEIDEKNQQLKERMLESSVIDLKTVYQETPFGREADVYRRHYLSEHITKTDFSDAIEVLAKKAKAELQEDIIASFLKNWESSTYQPHSNIAHQAFFHLIETQRFVTAIVDWRAIEIASFGRYLEQRYRITYAPEKDRLELPALENLQDQLEQKRETISERLKKGVIKELLTSLCKAITMIKARQEPKTQTPK